MNQMLHTPEGVRDIYDGELLRKEEMSGAMMKSIRSFGYERIQTPTFEFFDIFGHDVGTTPSKDLYKFFDKEGNTLVLRPDITPSIARAASKYFSDNTGWLRLCYEGNVYINNESLQGRLKESSQLGAELIGDTGVEGDAEIVSAAISCMTAAGFGDIKISLGHAAIFYGLMEACGFSEFETSEIADLINNRNTFGLMEYLDRSGISDDKKKLFKLLTSFYSGPNEWEDMMKVAEPYPKIYDALVYLKKLDELLKKDGRDEYVSYELGLISPYKYYTGIIFYGYTYDVGEPVVKGGRYDKLLGYFGKDACAVGFAVSVDILVMADTSQSHDKPKDKEDRYLTVALGKGRLAKKAMEYFEKIGIFADEMKDKDTRKLIFVNEEHKIRFFLAKGPDVPTYVEYGAADIGIVGEDTILEEGRNIYEVLDLGFGACRMCVCGPPEAAEYLKHQELIRVATKYPRIAKNYFNNIKGQTVEIIKLNGSIELAPIVGLSEVIVDIVETGSTLRENGLTILEEVAPLSARVVVNQVSMKMENERITKIITDLKNVIERESHDN